MYGLEILGILYNCVVIGIVLFVISLFSRLVKSNERIASAMEALASKLHREDK